MSESEITESLKRILRRYHDESARAVVSQETPDIDLLTDYRVIGELIAQFGTALIAFDDMEGPIGPPSEEMN